MKRKVKIVFCSVSLRERINLKIHKFNYFAYFLPLYNFCIFTAKCIDSYTEQRVLKVEKPDENITIDPRLEAIVDRMFKRCFDDGKYKQVIDLILIE